MNLRDIFYVIKPIIPRKLQILLRRKMILKNRSSHSDIWPVDHKASKLPDGWSGWPDQKQFALVLTHDVDTAKGHDKCPKLMAFEAELGFRSSFNFVPERYKVSSELRGCLASNGFEVGVHGLNHDGKLYKSKKNFQVRAARINEYLKNWGAVGFRSPSMHHNLEWINNLNIEYDASTFDTDPFEPQADGVGTIFPFWVNSDSEKLGYVELPYTLSQDFTLFVLMKERNIDIWKKKLDWIAHRGGMALLNTHPDYMNFSQKKYGIEEYPSKYYFEFLEHIKIKYEGIYWHALPREVANFYKHQAMRATNWR